MESPNGQAVRYLREQRKRKKRMIVFLCMAAIVVVGTVMALRMSGHAMNHTVLDCGLAGGSLHRHTEACYFTPSEEGAEKQLICGMADFVVHKHDEEACYKDGVLVCQLPEVQEHTHTEACYETRQVLACGLQPGEGGHVHSDACYGLALTCGLEESEGHVHDAAACYDEEGQLICALEESEGHIHGDPCYSTVLICGLNEGDGGHAHTGECYVQEQAVVCGKPEAHLHTHGEECYLHTVDQPDEAQVHELARQGIDVNQINFTVDTDGLPSEENRLVLSGNMPIFMCGQLQVLEHTHDDDCYKDVGPEDEPASQTGDESTGQAGQRSASYQSDRLQVTVAYEGGDFPENARICIERVDESEKILQKQEELDAGLRDKAPELKGLFKVTVTSGGEPVDLADPLLLTAVITDGARGEVVLAAWDDSVKESLEAQGIYVQSGEQEFELLSLTDQTEQGASAQILPGVVVGVGQKSAETDEASDGAPNKDAENQDGTRSDGLGIINVSQDYEYEDEDYQMIFHINGIARPIAETSQPEEAAEPDEFTEPDEYVEPEASAEPAEPAGPEDEADNSEEDGEDPASPEGVFYSTGPDSQPEDSGADDSAIAADGPEDGDLDSDGSGDGSSTWEPQDTQEPLGTAEPAQDPASAIPPEGITISGDILPANVMDDPEHPLALMVVRYEEGSETYEKYSDLIHTGDAQNGLPGMKVMTYALYYEGIELDISQCTVKLEVTAKPRLLRAAARISGSSSGDGEQETPVAIAVLTTETIQEKITEDEDEDRVFIAQDPNQQGIAPIADKQTQAEALVSSYIDGSFEGNFVAEILDKDNGSVQLTMGGSGPEEDFETMPMSGEQSVAETFDSAGPVMYSMDGGQYTVTSAASSDAAYFNDSIDLNPDGSKEITVIAVPAHDPTFNVEYYAVLDKVKESGGKGSKLTILNTRKASNGKLPKNGETNPTINIFVDSTGVVETEKILTKIYADVKDSKYYERPSLIYFSPGPAVKNAYELKQVWVTKKGESSPRIYGASEIIVDKQEKYDAANKMTLQAGDTFSPSPNENKDASEVIFTNRSDYEGKPGYIYISEGATIRLVYEPKSNALDNKANFYDYDISTGRVHRAKPPEDPNQYVYKTAGETFSGNSLTSTVLDWAKGLSSWDQHLYAYTKEQGINSSGNYTGSGTKLAFGNVNTGTGLGKLEWTNNGFTNNLPNKYNNRNGGIYQGSTFGLVTGLDSNWNIQYASGITAPKLFNEQGSVEAGSVTGKTSYVANQYRLNFSGKGDTYTLSAVAGTNTANLEHFSHPTNSEGEHTDIWTNNFWPMDSAPSFGSGTHDVKFGATATFKGGAHEMRFGPTTEKTGDYTFPESDDGQYHNSYFGMNFSLEFTLTDNYVGPLEYLFFGDDDMWVFLDGKLICDLGGVHLTVGEIVDLWDYLEKGSAGTHRLDFFYTERGASGSTCWMQFTLPSVRELGEELTSDDYGSLKFQKTVKNNIVDGGLTEGGIMEEGTSDEEFLFNIKLSKDGRDLVSAFRYEKYGKDNTPVNGIIDNNLDPDNLSAYNGAYFTLKKGEYIIIPELPVGTEFTIKEEGVLEKALTSKEGDNIIIKYVTKPEANQEHEYEAYVKGELLTDKEYTGTIENNNDNTVEVVFDNVYKSYVLPKTGGPGTLGFAGVGCAMVLAAGGLWARKKKHKR